MILYFARHAESLANTRRVISNRALPHPLTENGRAQARLLAQRFENTRLAAIYTSPVPRALETARVVGDALGLLPLVNDGLREFDVGMLEGRSDPLAWIRFSMLWNDWFYRQRLQKRVKGGESYLEAAARFSALTDELAGLYGNTPVEVLCISHGGILKVGLPGVMQNLTPEQVRDAAIAYTAVIKTENRNGNWICLDWEGVIPAAAG